MKYKDLDRAHSLRRERDQHDDNINRLAQAKFGEGTSHGDYFATKLDLSFRDDAMADAIRGAIRAELVRRRESVDEKLRGLGVEINTEGNAG